MTFKRPIYRILFFAAWILLLGGITTLVIAANGRSQVRLCKDVEISFTNGETTTAVSKQDVLTSMEQTAGGSFINKPVEGIRLSALEQKLEANPWIEDAELYFSTKEVLNVAVKERVPVARVFTTLGNSFYIDSAGHRMPLLKAWSARLPVVTGFTAAIRLNAKDSAVLQGVKTIVRFIEGDEFWQAQVGQIDITQEGKFELLPLISDAVIRLGYAEDIEQKLANLLVFYKQVMPKAGFTKYAALDLQFNGQVVAVKKGPASVVDSIQLQKNIAELMKRKEAEQQADSLVAALPRTTSAPKPEIDSVRKPITTPVQQTAEVPPANSSASAAKPVTTKTVKPKPASPKPKPVQQTVPSKPRAVMPQRNEY